MKVKQLFQQYAYLESRRNDGDLNAVDILIDLDSAIQMSGINDRQRQFIHQHYVQGYTQQEVADSHGVLRTSVANSIKRAESRIQEVYTKWGE